MRMVPRELIPSVGITTSELRVHSALADLDVPGVVLHSLNLPDHDYKLSAEIDFLVVTDDLLLVVEVKGARVASSDGLWTYSDRRGHHRTSREGPFRQASSAMFALRTLVADRLGAERTAGLAYGFLVVTPDVDLPPSVEWNDETYIGRRLFVRRTGLRDGLRRASPYWLAKQPHGQRSGAMKNSLLEVLRPNFDRTPGLAARAESLDVSYQRLTDEQYSRLDLITENPRVLCSGGAGTGKTFLAAEIARRRRIDNDRVLVTCRSEVLANFLTARTAEPGMVVKSFDRLGEVRGQVPSLVVDEAQDFMTFEHLDALDAKLTGGLDGGRWAMFYDPNKQTHIHGGFDPAALEMLLGTGAVPARLKTNCRNTREIAFQTRSLTGADLGVTAAGSGPEVQFVTVENDREETGRLDAHLGILRDQDVPPEHITLVSLRGDWNTSSARSLRATRKGRVQRLEVAWSASWPGSSISWASAADVKGLENRFVCVIDVDELDTDEALDKLYVALSRARAGLWMAVRTSVVDCLRELYRLHSPAALEALGKGNKGNT